MPAAEAAQASALALLARSVAMGHRRLALLRLLAAVRVRAVVPASDWAYCDKVASQAADEALRSLFAEAERTAGGGLVRTDGQAPMQPPDPLPEDAHGRCGAHAADRSMR